MEARIFMPGPRIPRRCLGESYMQVFPRSVAPPCADTVRAGLSALGARVLEGKARGTRLVRSSNRRSCERHDELRKKAFRGLRGSEACTMHWSKMAIPKPCRFQFGYRRWRKLLHAAALACGTRHPSRYCREPHDMWPQATSDQGRQGARRRSAEIVEATPRDVSQFDNLNCFGLGSKLLRLLSLRTSPVMLCTGQ